MVPVQPGGLRSKSLPIFSPLLPSDSPTVATFPKNCSVEDSG